MNKKAGKDISQKTNQKKAGMSILMWDKIDCRTKTPQGTRRDST